MFCIVLCCVHHIGCVLGYSQVGVLRGEGAGLKFAQCKALVYRGLCQSSGDIGDVDG